MQQPISPSDRQLGAYVYFSEPKTMRKLPPPPSEYDLSVLLLSDLTKGLELDKPTNNLSPPASRSRRSTGPGLAESVFCMDASNNPSRFVTPIPSRRPSPISYASSQNASVASSYVRSSGVELLEYIRAHNGNANAEKAPVWIANNANPNRLSAQPQQQGFSAGSGMPPPHPAADLDAWTRGLRSLLKIEHASESN